MSKNTDG